MLLSGASCRSRPAADARRRHRSVPVFRRLRSARLLVLLRLEDEQIVRRADDAEHQRERDENGSRQHRSRRYRYATIWTCSNMSIGSGCPDAASRSLHFGRMPVARNRPVTLPAGANAGLLEQEDVLHRDDFAFHAGDLGDRRDLARAVRLTRDLHDEVDGRRHLLPDGAVRDVQVRHRDHRVETIQRVARRVGVNRRQAPVVAGVHGLQHVERFGAADLADDDAVGTHTQGVDHELARSHGALALDVGRPRLEPHDVPLAQHQFRRVLDRDDALVVRDEARQDVEQRRLAGAGAARHDDVQPAVHGRLQEVEHRLRQRLALDQVLRAQAVGAETADRQHGPSSASGGMIALTREPSCSRASTIGLDSSMRRPTELTMRSMICIRWRSSLKVIAGFLEQAVPLDVDLVVAVDQDVRDVAVLEQRLERPEAEQLVEDVDDQVLALEEAERASSAASASIMWLISSRISGSASRRLTRVSRSRFRRFSSSW